MLTRHSHINDLMRMIIRCYGNTILRICTRTQTRRRTNERI